MNDVDTKKSLADASLNTEVMRLEALRGLNILDTPHDPILDRITALAAQLVGVPVALLDFVETNRIWSKSHFGTDVTEYKLELGFCASAILGDDPYVINDAKTDARCAGHPLAQDENGIRFYAAIPLKTHDNYNVGTLCVVDFIPRQITPDQLKILQELANISISFVELNEKINLANEISKIENKIKQKELQNQLILNSTVEGIHVIDLQGTVFVENDAAIKMLGWEAERLIGKPAHETLHHHHADFSDYPKCDCPIYKTLSDGQPRHVTDEVFWRKDGSSFPVEYSTSALRDLDGNLYGTTVVFRDITARKANEEKIQRLAYYDALTDLPNRTLFIDRLEQEINKAERLKLQVLLIFIDLDRFKAINDTLGHHVGDQLLAEAARRLKGCVRNTDTVARLGGDEFTVILNEVSDLDAVERVLDNILKAMAIPFLLNDQTIYLSASMGVTIFPDDAKTVESLLINADQAMYGAKKAGRNRTHFFSSATQDHNQSRLRLINDLHEAIQHNEFFLTYQPIVELSTGEVKKAEALIRWQHPTKGLISPADFIPIAEEIGLITQIGQWVFEQVTMQLKHLEAQHVCDFQISVNISPMQFTDVPNLHGDWLDHLKSVGLTGKSICGEITEGLLLDASHDIKSKLLGFRNAGMKISLDDFGTGYSSLSYLTKFSIDFIKIDRSFVNNLSPDTDDYALCEAIILMAHRLNIKVIAEGIETELQLNLLKNAGCDYGQGYYFAKPLSHQNLMNYLVNKAQ